MVSVGLEFAKDIGFIKNLDLNSDSPFPMYPGELIVGWGFHFVKRVGASVAGRTEYGKLRGGLDCRAREIEALAH